MLRTGSNISHSSGRIKEKLVGRVFLLFWENDRAAITIISWGFGGGLGGGGWVLWAPSGSRAEPKPRKVFWIFIVFSHKNVLNKNRFERNKSRKYTVFPMVKVIIRFSATEFRKFNIFWRKIKVVVYIRLLSQF